MDIGHYTVQLPSVVPQVHVRTTDTVLMDCLAFDTRICSQHDRTRQPQHQLDHTCQKGREHGLLCTDTACVQSSTTGRQHDVMLCHVHGLAGDPMPRLQLASRLHLMLTHTQEYNTPHCGSWPHNI